MKKISVKETPRKCHCGWCVCARVSGTGVSSLGGWAAGRRQAQALCTWSVSGSWPGPGSRPVSQAHTQTHAAGTRQLWGDSRLGSIISPVSRVTPVMGWSSQHDAVSTHYITPLSAGQCSVSLRQWTHWSKWWQSHDASLIVHYGCLLDMKVASVFCLGHGRKRTQLPLSDSILLDQRDEKPKASGEFPVKLPKKDWISEILNGQQQAWL